MKMLMLKGYSPLFQNFMIFKEDIMKLSNYIFFFSLHTIKVNGSKC